MWFACRALPTAFLVLCQVPRTTRFQAPQRTDRRCTFCVCDVSQLALQHSQLPECQTRLSTRYGCAGKRTLVELPARTTPLKITTPVTKIHHPALRTETPSGMRPRADAAGPAQNQLGCSHGLHRPVSLTIADSPMCNQESTGSASKSRSRVVMFLPRWPGGTLRYLAANSLKSTA